MPPTARARPPPRGRADGRRPRPNRIRPPRPRRQWRGTRSTERAARPPGVGLRSASRSRLARHAAHPGPLKGARVAVGRLSVPPADGFLVADAVLAVLAGPD